MDTNASQALKMAGGILIAVVIIATLTYFFRSLTPFQQQIEDIEALEQTADFNKEYEVYNKNLMYGIDLISVINKAYGNNKKYIDEYGYSQDLKDNYLIDIELETPVTLKQTLIVNDIYDEVNGEIIEKNPSKVNVSSISPPSIREEVKKEIANKLRMKEEDIEKIYDDKIISGKLIVPGAGNDTNENMYIYIIEESVKDLKRNARNNNTDTIKIWGTATLETYAYSLKNKKFKCTGVENSKNTGRIIKMNFKEIEI
ncbi:MAG: hypothetical protein ACI4UE_05400 [Candidatus Scatovivens sp.]